MITITVESSAAIAKLNGFPAKFREALVRVVTRLGIELQARVKGKLSGEVLHVRTGTLRRSINRETVQAPDGVFGIVGTNVSYARIHEFGFDGEVTVAAHLRRSKAQFALPKTKRPGKSEGEVFVKQHTRHVKLPPRSFLRSALKEFEPKILAEIAAAGREAMR